LHLIPEVAFWLFVAIIVQYILSNSDNSVAFNICIATVVFFLAMVLRRYWSIKLVNHHSQREQIAQRTPLLLALSSKLDEAWQLLYHARSANNPLAPTLNAFSYTVLAARATFAQKAAADRIYYGKTGFVAAIAALVVYILLILFAAFVVNVALRANAPGAFIGEAMMLGSVPILALLIGVVVACVGLLIGRRFFLALSSPFRLGRRCAASLGAVFPAILIYVVRSAGWSVILKTAMGLEGYRFKVPLVEQDPSYLDHQLVRYENIPVDVERRALEKRDTWFARVVEDISLAFSKELITTSDISSLLARIEADQTLIHAAYYTDDKCIARIADWIVEEPRNCPD
jgi:hypothetical protein